MRVEEVAINNSAGTTGVNQTVPGKSGREVTLV